MNFVADENLDEPIVHAVRALGYKVLFVAESSPGISDSRVLALALSNHAVLLTADKDFGELVFR